MGHKISDMRFTNKTLIGSKMLLVRKSLLRTDSEVVVGV